jgi:sulfite reductase (NADPH) flavoprotein alpha-component
MAKDVETALTEIIAEHGDRSRQDAARFVAELKASDRYQADVY